jgi:DHA1 family tetracycline resistance protein-like MFS transporter
MSRTAATQPDAARNVPGSGVDASAGRPPRAALAIVFLTVFIDLLGFGIVLPVMPRQAEPHLGALGLQPWAVGTMIGVLFSAFSLMQFLFSPFWGRISDRVGRRPILLLSLTGSVIFYALYGYAVTFTDPGTVIGLMLVSRIGAGIAGASVGTAAAVIADCTPPERRARGMALIGIAFGAGFTLGPLIAYFGLAAFDQQPWGVGALASLLSLAALLLAIALFRETRRPDAANARGFIRAGRMADVLRMPFVGLLVLTYFLAIFAFANFESTLARLTEQAFAMSDDQNFLVFAFIGCVLMVAGGSYRPLAMRMPEARLLSAGVAMMTAGLAGIGLVAWQATRGDAPASMAGVPLTAWLYLMSAVAVAGFAFVNPSVSALISRHADPARQGEVLGVNQSFASLGRILGPFFGSLLFSLHASRTLPFATAVIVLLVVSALLPRLRGEGPRQA